MTQLRPLSLACCSFWLAACCVAQEPATTVSNQNSVSRKASSRLLAMPTTIESCAGQRVALHRLMWKDMEAVNELPPDDINAATKAANRAALRYEGGLLKVADALKAEAERDANARAQWLLTRGDALKAKMLRVGNYSQEGSRQDRLALVQSTGEEAVRAYAEAAKQFQAEWKAGKRPLWDAVEAQVASHGAWGSYLSAKQAILLQNTDPAEKLDVHRVALQKARDEHEVKSAAEWKPWLAALPEKDATNQERFNRCLLQHCLIASESGSLPMKIAIGTPEEKEIARKKLADATKLAMEMQKLAIPLCDEEKLPIAALQELFFGGIGGSAMRGYTPADALWIAEHGLTNARRIERATTDKMGADHPSSAFAQLIVAINEEDIEFRRMLAKPKPPAAP